jgi:hypothetical protein
MKNIKSFEDFLKENRNIDEEKIVTIYFKGGAISLTVNMTDDEIRAKYPKGKVMSYGPGRSKKSGPIKRIEIKSINEVGSNESLNESTQI